MAVVALDGEEGAVFGEVPFSNVVWRGADVAAEHEDLRWWR